MNSGKQRELINICEQTVEKIVPDACLLQLVKREAYQQVGFRRTRDTNLNQLDRACERIRALASLQEATVSSPQPRRRKRSSSTSACQAGELKPVDLSHSESHNVSINLSRSATGMATMSSEVIRSFLVWEVLKSETDVAYLLKVGAGDRAKLWTALSFATHSSISTLHDSLRFPETH